MKPDSFFPYVLPEVMGCPDPMLKQAIVSAAAEFCRETLCWTEFHDPIVLQSGGSEYELDVPAQAFLLTVRDVWLGVKALLPTTMAALQQAMPSWQTAQSSEPTYYNAATERGSIRVFPKPVAPTLSLVVRASYCPVMSAISLPDFLGQRFAEAIAAGAKSRLMMIPDASWSNPTLGGYHRQIFTGAITTAQIEEMHDRVQGSLTIQSRRFI